MPLDSTEEKTIRAGSRDWTALQAVEFRLMFSDTKLLVKDVARMWGIHPRVVHSPHFRKALGIQHIKRPRHGGRNNLGKIAIPKNAHPLVRQLFAVINRERASLAHVSEKAGLCRCGIGFWRKQMPRLDTFEAAANAVGYKLALVPIDASKWGKEEDG